MTGTLWSGSSAAGRRCGVEPRGRRRACRSLEVHDRAVERAAPGQRVALNLAGVGRDEVRARRRRHRRRSRRCSPTYLVDAAVELLARRTRRCAGARASTSTTARARRPAGSRRSRARRSSPASAAFAQLRLERPLVPAAGDRFVLRQIAPPDTIGGGVVVDPRPRKHGPGTEHVERLRALASGDPLERLAAELDDAPSGMRGRRRRARAARAAAPTGRAAPVGGASRALLRPPRLDRGARPASWPRSSGHGDGAGEPRRARARRRAGRRRPRGRARDLVARGRGVVRSARASSRRGMRPPRGSARRRALLAAPRADGLEPRAARRSPPSSSAEPGCRRATRSSGSPSTDGGRAGRSPASTTTARRSRQRAPRSSSSAAGRLGHDRAAARRARHQPQVRAGAARALRRRAADAPARATSTCCAADGADGRW